MGSTNVVESIEEDKLAFRVNDIETLDLTNEIYEEAENKDNIEIAENEDETIEFEYVCSERKKLLLCVEDLLAGEYSSIESYPTILQISSAISKIEKLKASLDDPELKIGDLKPPTTNNNRKGRNAKSGVKSSTERRKIFREIFEEKQKKEQKMIEKKQKEIEAIDSLNRSRQSEELKGQRQLKKTKVTLLVRGDDNISYHPVKKEAGTTASPTIESLPTFNNPKKDGIFKKLNIDRLDAIKAIHSVGDDGNCGFRAAALSVYQDQSCCYTVKAKMLEQYMMYRDTLYMADEIEEVANEQEQAVIKRLESAKLPCLDDTSLWFSTFVCPQILADTYQRPVILYIYTKNTIRSTGELREIKEVEVYWSLIHMELDQSDHPIALLLASNHFYLIEYKSTPKGRMKKFQKPPVNIDHTIIRR
ncbi:hypothetical protein BDB01DRAFT_905340 [Pilobolus umbonatus]|nr:hypothetical protein BDB01DRAFT_905340 [Pilobolus umbonatus]